MLRFPLFGIPVFVEGWFWLTTILFGGGASARDGEDWARVAVWVAVVFVSILVHELGHALIGKRYGASPSIRLHGFGGVTFLPGASFTRGQHILVSAAGPAAGFLLGGMVWLIPFAQIDLPWYGRLAVRDALWVNLFWTVANLLPIQPLDGGQILAQVLGPSRVRMTSLIGGVVASAVFILALQYRLIFSAMFLAMLAYYNFKRMPVEGGVITQ